MPITAPEGYLDISNATLRGSEIITTSNVGVMNANPTMALSVGSNLHVNVYSSNVLQVSGNIVAEGLKLGLIEIIPSYDFAAVSNVGNTTVSTIQFSNATTAFKTTSNIALGGHILPIANETYDIGSPEYKIRDLFVGTNSMWIGDQTKIAFENGKMKFKQRKLDKVPKVIKDLVINSVENSITTESEVESAAIAYVQAQFPDDSITALEDLKLQHWKAYTKTIDDTKEISDIFIDNDEDYNAQSSADAWREVGSNVYSTQRIAIGAATEPRAILDVNDTGAMIVPTGTTVQRPSTGIEGMFRYNSQTGYIEWYTTSGWTAITTSPVVHSFTPKSIPYGDVATEVITLTGESFDAGSTIRLEGADGTLYDTTDFTFTNSSTVSFKIGTLAAGQAANRPYKLLLTNGAGRSAKSDSVVGFTPTWTSPASGSTQYAGTVGSNPITLSATDGAGGSSVTYSVVGSLPGGLTISGNTISGISMAAPGTQVSVTIRATDASGTSNYSDRTFTIKSIVNAGEAVFKTVTSRSWTVPEGVTSICALVIGGGGGAFNTTSNSRAGGGGGLAYRNKIAVTPGTTYTVAVGGGGGTNASGGTSSIASLNLYATGGTAGNSGGAGGYPSGTYDGGGRGGTGRSTGRTTRYEFYGGGGGGAAGYTGNGGSGCGDYYMAEPGSGGGGGGGGGVVGSVEDNVSGGPRTNNMGLGAGGGGVGIYGQGADGNGGIVDAEDTDGMESYTRGQGGSGGTDGTSGATCGGDGGNYGGGGGGLASIGSGASRYILWNYHRGGQGVVRIIWGPGRVFPSTNVDQSSSYGNVTTY